MAHAQTLAMDVLKFEDAREEDKDQAGSVCRCGGASSETVCLSREDQLKYAMKRFAFYQCYQCRRPYYGGRRDCEDHAEENLIREYNPRELICGSCAAKKMGHSCPIHGSAFMLYKCKFCCNVANWFCWGNTHFCDQCHSKQENGDFLTSKPISKLPQCPGISKCPIKMPHPPPGVEFVIGCGLCRAANADR
eukprot:TRINITY_DN579_c0_g1_i2.p1 TRINITY_DN579_c0_g1~~TRINITY_DN579_c0_g1_i2.p1  ORF type:complete len:220 (-),score=36.22 TRINITY_DN579_c0_g1_i2:78-653(-)